MKESLTIQGEVKKKKVLKKRLLLEAMRNIATFSWCFSECCRRTTFTGNANELGQTQCNSEANSEESDYEES